MRSPATTRRPFNATGRRTAATFRFHLLGALHVERGDRPVAPPPTRAHGLLAALLLNPGPQSREHLAVRLFPDLPEEVGRRRLSDLLWLLRRALPGLAVEIDAQAIDLPAAARRLDVEEFRAAAAGPDLAGWQAALELYRGDLLEGLYDDWLLEEREALRLEHVNLLQRTCGALAARRQFADALLLAERLVQSEPYDEEALRTLMQILRALGRRGAALAAYERFVTLAAEELATEPEPATQAVARALRSAEYSARLDVPLTPSPDKSPPALLRYGQEALARGVRATADACRRELLNLPRGNGMREAQLLEIDAALFYEEWDGAAQLLAACDVRDAAVQARAARLALERHDTQAAHDTALGALARAQATRDRQSELEALLVLAAAQEGLGRALQAGRAIEQALNLARASGSPLHAGQALALRAHALVRQGNHAQALTLFHEVAALAHEHGLTFNLAEALHGIGSVNTNRGELRAALETQLQELSLWRDLGLRGREAEALHYLSYTYARLGRNAEAQLPLEQAREIYLEIGDPVRLAMNDYHRGAGLCYLDDAEAPRAIEILRGAAAVFHAHKQAGWEASTLRTLGYAWWVAGRHSKALPSLRDAYALHAQLEEFGMLPEILAYQGLAHLGLGDARHIAAGLDCTRRAMLALAQGEVSDEVVAEIRYAHAMALAANGDEPGAQAELQCAYENLLAVAATLEDEPARQAFFEHNPTTRRLMRELHARGLVPDPANGVVARALPAARGGGPVPVTWTLDAGPADHALKQGRGAIALRRARLARLISEAAAQGANPTVAQLAEALGVSERTIQRDLGARGAGCEVRKA